MFNRLSSIHKSASSPRVRRTTTIFALATLCVIVSVAGPVLLRQHESQPRNLAANGKSVGSSRAEKAALAQASSRARSNAERSAESADQKRANSEAYEINKENSRLAEARHRDQSVSENATKSMAPTTTAAQEVESDTNKGNNIVDSPSDRAYTGVDVTGRVGGIRRVS
jgi:hypothetical protein